MLIRALIVGALVLLVFAPSLWVRAVLARNQRRRASAGLTGAEVARKLLAEAGLPDVAVERAAPAQDHYDPAARAVRLAPEHFDGRSLAAVVVAAHEVGHAVQHGDRYGPLMSRTKLAAVAATTQKIGALAMMALPVVALASRSPRAGLWMLAAGALTLGAGAALHLLTLPVELDASFKRALPRLDNHGLVSDDERAEARVILKAAAMTYLAAALASVLNVGRWLLILRR